MEPSEELNTKSSKKEQEKVETEINKQKNVVENELKKLNINFKMTSPIFGNLKLEEEFEEIDTMERMRKFSIESKKNLEEGPPLIVGFCGGSSCGKSFITAWLKEKFEKLNISVCILKEKNFLKSFSINNEEDMEKYLINYDFDNPDAIDWDFFKRAINNLEMRKPFDTPIYDFVNNKRIMHTEKIMPSDLILLEGRIYWQDEFMKNKCNIKIFLDTDLDLMLSRYVYKNIARKRNLTEILDRYVKFVKPGYISWTEPTKCCADIVVPNFGGTIYDIRFFEQNYQILNILLDLFTLRIKNNDEDIIV
jgi:uridine kinase